MPEVEQIAAWVPVTDESIVDFGIGTPEEIEAAARRIEVRERAAERRWRALPWRVRAWRTVLYWWRGLRG